jgi:hypothetical protein
LFVTCVRHRPHLHRLLQRRYLSDNRVLIHMCSINISVATYQFSHCYLYSGMRKKMWGITFWATYVYWRKFIKNDYWRFTPKINRAPIMHKSWKEDKNVVKNIEVIMSSFIKNTCLRKPGMSPVCGTQFEYQQIKGCRHSATILAHPFSLSFFFA